MVKSKETKETKDWDPVNLDSRQQPKKRPLKKASETFEEFFKINYNLIKKAGVDVSFEQILTRLRSAEKRED